jgi:hypothetical protein
MAYGMGLLDDKSKVGLDATTNPVGSPQGGEEVGTPPPHVHPLHLVVKS